MAMQRRETVPRLHIPQFDALVIAATGQRLAVRTQGHRTNQIAMSLKLHTTPTALNIPQLNPLVIAAAGKRLAIGTEGHRPDIISITLQIIETAFSFPRINF